MHECAYHSLKKGGGKSPESTSPQLHDYLHADFVRHHPKIAKKYSLLFRSTCSTSKPTMSPLNIPALAHNLPSSWMRWMVRGTDGLSPLKTTLFLCFQIIHIPRRHLALCARLLVEFPSCLIAHCCICSFCLGSRSTLLVSRPMLDQICLANTQT